MDAGSHSLGIRVKEFAMRFAPAALALSLLAAVTSSVGFSRDADPVDLRAQALLNGGREQLARGDTAAATDSFEAALAVDPGYVGTYLALGEAARRTGLQGKAIHYYRTALERDPNNLAAISGEGGAMVEKGALDKARRNLAKLEGLCGKACPDTQLLASAIARGPVPKVVSAQAVTPKPVVESN
jgi:tetratricopeptide (TPR) repeat protein